MGDSLNKTVVLWLGDQIINREATAHDIHKQFVELRRDLE